MIQPKVISVAAVIQHVSVGLALSQVLYLGSVESEARLWFWGAGDGGGGFWGWGTVTWDQC